VDLICRPVQRASVLHLQLLGKPGLIQLRIILNIMTAHNGIPWRLHIQSNILLLPVVVAVVEHSHQADM
jgi:hypothetical protein